MESLSLGFILVRVQCPEVITVHVSKFIRSRDHIQIHIQITLLHFDDSIGDKKSLVFLGKWKDSRVPRFILGHLKKLGWENFNRCKFFNKGFPDLDNILQAGRRLICCFIFRA